jgi:ATP phosphoribosyltransferase regulatory subunit
VSTIRLPSGVRDFLPRAAARRRALASRVETVFDAWGYARVITPVFEVSDVLERGLGAAARAQAIRFVEPGTGQVVALRPDITPQIARLVATRLADIPGPYRLCYEGTVTRLAGEFGQREILQAGIELVDPDRVLAGVALESEVLALAWAALDALGLPEKHLDVGHVAPAAFVLGAAPTDDTRDRLVAAISRKDRAGVRACARALPEAVAPLADALVTLWGPAGATLERFELLAWPASVRAAVRELSATLDALPFAVHVDLGDLRGFDYYTGMKFAAYAGGAPDAVLRGGRYDELLGRYGRSAHAAGFAMDLEAIAGAQRAAGIAPPRRATGVAVDDPAIAIRLREAGVRAVVQTPVTAAWLRGAGLDAAIAGDQLILADDSRRSAADAIQTARSGDTKPLIALLQTL